MPKTRVIVVSESLRSTETSAGGGGSTPANGSVSSFRFRSFGENTSTRNSATNGNDGRRFVARMLFVGSSIATTCAITPSSKPPRNATPMLDSAASTAAEIAATTSGV